MWWRFRKHKLALISALVVIGFYAVVLGADFLAYADPNASEAQRSLMPPQRVHFFDGWRFAPYVHGIKGVRDPQSFRYTSMPANPHLTDADLEALVAYFRAMSERKRDPRAEATK